MMIAEFVFMMGGLNFPAIAEMVVQKRCEAVLFRLGFAVGLICQLERGIKSSHLMNQGLDARALHFRS